MTLAVARRRFWSKPAARMPSTSPAVSPTYVKTAISGTGFYAPPSVISNDELVASFNAYVEADNRANAEAIARGERAALDPSSSEFILKASGIRRRHVVDRVGILDP